jgi:hypothetical protein
MIVVVGLNSKNVSRFHPTAASFIIARAADAASLSIAL